MKITVAMTVDQANEIHRSSGPRDNKLVDTTWRTHLWLLEKRLGEAFPGTAAKDELRIFLAPEYFFRKGGWQEDLGSGVKLASGPSYFSEPEFKEILEGVKKLTVNKELILVPGTILWLHHGLIRNTMAVVYKGSVRWLYHKHSDASELCAEDKKSVQVSTLVKPRGFFKRLFHGKYEESKVDLTPTFQEGREAPSFKLEVMGQKLLMGLEVCADHAHGTLKKHLDQERCDFHIVVANPVTVNRDAVAARQGRYYLLCSALEKKKLGRQLARESSMVLARVSGVTEKSAVLADMPAQAFKDDKTAKPPTYAGVRVWNPFTF